MQGCNRRSENQVWATGIRRHHLGYDQRQRFEQSAARARAPVLFGNMNWLDISHRVQTRQRKDIPRNVRNMGELHECVRVLVWP